MWLFQTSVSLILWLTSTNDWMKKDRKKITHNHWISSLESVLPINYGFLFFFELRWWCRHHKSQPFFLKWVKMCIFMLSFPLISLKLETKMWTNADDAMRCDRWMYASITFFKEKRGKHSECDLSIQVNHIIGESWVFFFTEHVVSFSFSNNTFQIWAAWAKKISGPNKDWGKEHKMRKACGLQWNASKFQTKKKVCQMKSLFQLLMYVDFNMHPKFKSIPTATTSPRSINFIRFQNIFEAFDYVNGRGTDKKMAERKLHYSINR